jgi:hypothetical protein
MDASLDEELKELQRRGLWPHPSSVTPTKALSVAMREGETILDTALSETLAELKRSGATIDDIVDAVLPAFEQCVDNWARRAVDHFLIRAKVPGRNPDLVRRAAWTLKNRLQATVAPELMKLSLQETPESDSLGPAQLDPSMLHRLRELNTDLSDMYSQIITDLNDPERRTTRDVANGIRELVRDVVESLLPGDAEAETRRDRLRCILRERDAGSRAEETAAAAQELVEAKADLYVKWSDRAGEQVHSGSERHDLIQLWRLADYLLHELLAP